MLGKVNNIFNILNFYRFVRKRMGNTCLKGKVGVMNRTIQLLMVGLDNAGKTCTAKSIVKESLGTIFTIENIPIKLKKTF